MTTCASAGATLVAIIGGLLISRQIGLEADLAAKRQQLATTKALEISALTQRDESQLALDRLEIESCLAAPDVLRYFQQLTQLGENVNLQGLRTINPDLHEYSDELVMKLALQWLGEFSIAEKSPVWHLVTRQSDWDAFMRRFNLPVKIEAIWLAKFKQTQDALPHERYEELSPRSVSRVKHEEHRRLVRLRDDANTSFLIARAQRNMMETLDERINVGPVRSSLLILGAVTIGTVIVPVLYLTPSVARGPLSPAMISAAFIISVVGLFAYIALEVLLIERRRRSGQ